jgi:hypothetical protein
MSPCGRQAGRTSRAQAPCAAAQCFPLPMLSVPPSPAAAVSVATAAQAPAAAPPLACGWGARPCERWGAGAQGVGLAKVGGGAAVGLGGHTPWGRPGVLPPPARRGWQCCGGRCLQRRAAGAQTGAAPRSPGGRPGGAPMGRRGAPVLQGGAAGGVAISVRLGAAGAPPGARARHRDGPGGAPRGHLGAPGASAGWVRGAGEGVRGGDGAAVGCVLLAARPPVWGAAFGWRCRGAGAGWWGGGRGPGPGRGVGAPNRVGCGRPRAEGAMVGVGKREGPCKAPGLAPGSVARLVEGAGERARGGGGAAAGCASRAARPPSRGAAAG